VVPLAIAWQQGYVNGSTVGGILGANEMGSSVLIL